METDEIKAIYNLPGEISVALTSGRPELLKVAIRKIDQSDLLDKDTQMEVLRLLGDLITDKQKANKKIQDLNGKLKDIALIAEGLENTLSEFQKSLRGFW